MTRPPQSASALQATANRTTRLAAYAALAATLTAWLAVGSVWTFPLVIVQVLAAASAAMKLRMDKADEATGSLTTAVMAGALSVGDAFPGLEQLPLFADLLNIVVLGVAYRLCEQARHQRRAAWAVAREERRLSHLAADQPDRGLHELAKKQRAAAEDELGYLDELAGTREVVLDLAAAEARDARAADDTTADDATVDDLADATNERADA